MLFGELAQLLIDNRYPYELVIFTTRLVRSCVSQEITVLNLIRIKKKSDGKNYSLVYAGVER